MAIFPFGGGGKGHPYATRIKEGKGVTAGGLHLYRFSLSDNPICCVREVNLMHVHIIVIVVSVNCNH